MSPSDLGVFGLDKRATAADEAVPHEKLHGIRRVSNPATRKDLAARTWGVFWY